MIELKNRNDVERWLMSRPQAARWRNALALATRAATRALPLATALRGFDLTTATFRATALARISVLHATRPRELRNAALAAVGAVDTSVHGAALSASVAAFAAGGAAAAAAAAPEDPNGFAARAVDAAASAADSYGGEAIIWNAASTDASLIEARQPILSRALWLQPDPERKRGYRTAVPPNWAADAWESLGQRLLAEGDHWQVWIDWYEAILRGKSPFPKLKGKARESLEMQIALIPDEEWQKGAEHANGLIRNLIDEAHAHLKEPQPKVPTPRASAIRPVWKGGKMVLPRTALPIDVSEPTLESLLQTLKGTIAKLVADCEADLRRAEQEGRPRNIDVAPLDYLRHVESLISTGVPPQHELFQIFHAGDALLAYAKAVNEEWPNLLAARYHALTMLFGQVADKSEAWREIKATPITKQEAADIPVAATELAEILSDPETAEIISNEVPAALETLVEPLAKPPDPRRDPMAELKAVNERLAADVVNAMDNILQRATEAWQWVEETPPGKVLSGSAKKWWEEYAKEFTTQSGKLGKLMGRLSVWGTASGVSWLIAAKFPWFIPIAVLVTAKMKESKAGKGEPKHAAKARDRKRK